MAFENQGRKDRITFSGDVLDGNVYNVEPEADFKILGLRAYDADSGDPQDSLLEGPDHTILRVEVITNRPITGSEVVNFYTLLPSGYQTFDSGDSVSFYEDFYGDGGSYPVYQRDLDVSLDPQLDPRPPFGSPPLEYALWAFSPSRSSDIFEVPWFYGPDPVAPTIAGGEANIMFAFHYDAYARARGCLVLKRAISDNGPQTAKFQVCLNGYLVIKDQNWGVQLGIIRVPYLWTSYNGKLKSSEIVVSQDLVTDYADPYTNPSSHPTASAVAFTLEISKGETIFVVTPGDGATYTNPMYGDPNDPYAVEVERSGLPSLFGEAYCNDHPDYPSYEYPGNNSGHNPPFASSGSTPGLTLISNAIYPNMFVPVNGFVFYVDDPAYEISCDGYQNIASTFPNATSSPSNMVTFTGIMDEQTFSVLKTYTFPTPVIMDDSLRVLLVEGVCQLSPAPQFYWSGPPGVFYNLFGARVDYQTVEFITNLGSHLLPTVDIGVSDTSLVWLDPHSEVKDNRTHLRFKETPTDLNGAGGLSLPVSWWCYPRLSVSSPPSGADTSILPPFGNCIAPAQQSSSQGDYYYWATYYTMFFVPFKLPAGEELQAINLTHLLSFYDPGFSSAHMDIRCWLLK